MNSAFFKLERMTPEERTVRLTEKMNEMVRLGYEKSSRVKTMMDRIGCKPTDIATLDDFQKLPVISREKLIDYEHEEPPYGGFCAQGAKVDRIFISPGPVYEPHLAETDHLWARAYRAAGFGQGDVVLNAFSYHMVAAGLTFHGGLRHVGATVVPSGSSGTQAQADLIRDLQVTGYTGTPSFLMAILQKGEELGYDFPISGQIKRACFGAEPLFPHQRERFEQYYHIDTYQMYGATEVGDIAYECYDKKGWHLCEEVLVEIVDPETGRRVPDGEMGEVVVTRFNSVFFLLRFGTGDLSRLITEPCRCGRTAQKLAGIFGRVGDAVKVRGMFLAPSQLMALRKRFDDMVVQARVSYVGERDYLTLRIESEKTGEAQIDLMARFGQIFREVCNLRIDRIEMVSPGSLKDEKALVDERTWK